MCLHWFPQFVLSFCLSVRVQDDYISALADSREAFEVATERWLEKWAVLNQGTASAGSSRWVGSRRQLQANLDDAIGRQKRKVEEAECTLIDGIKRLKTEYSKAMELVELADYTEEVIRRITENAEEQASSQAAGVVARQDAGFNYRQLFAEASGRSIADGAPGAHSAQPVLPESLASSTVTDADFVSWWCKFGGFRGAQELDEFGWTPLHHAMQATVHWEHAARVCRGLIMQMTPEWLEVKTLGGRPAGWSALHMCCNGSDRLLQRAPLAAMLIQGNADVECEDPNGRTPFCMRRARA